MDAVADVVLLLPVPRVYSYLVPPHMADAVRRGVQVKCPVRSRVVPGIVFEVRDPSPDDPKLSPLAEVVRSRPPWPDDLMRLISWASSYYVAPMGQVARTAMPSLFAARVPGPVRLVCLARPPSRPSRSARVQTVIETLQREGPLEISRARRLVPGGARIVRDLLARGVLRIEEKDRAEEDGPEGETRQFHHEFEPTDHQREALDKIEDAVARRVYKGFLLHGVTGSGKTEVYLRAMERARSEGLSAVVLVPEIALTVELRRAFTSRFGDDVAVLHSAMPQARRVKVWDAILHGRHKIVVGARSAVFAPVHDLGLVVVDEEHENTYKQQDYLRYNARDLAMVRASLAGCPVVLGSATPSLETFHNAHVGKLEYLSIPERVEDRPLPEVQFVDLRYSSPRDGGRMFSPPLLDALRTTVDRGESAILFLNRRGFGRFAVCGTCGSPVTCPNCSIALTHHVRPDRLVCHYCDHSIPVPTNCPSCGASDMSVVGYGTERVEEEVAALVPGARCLRLDSGTAGGGGLDKTLAAFRAGEANVLVGTQIVAKGHDFPMVTFVGVLLAEQSLAFPDFRAAERTFQLLTQVAGRAGRGDRPGRVLIQTWDPDQYALKLAASHDYLGFAVVENRVRKERGYPPHAYLAAVEVSSKDAVQARKEASVIRDYLDQFAMVEAPGDELTILGPASAPIERLRGRTRYQLMLKSPRRSSLNRVLWALYRVVGNGHGGLRITIDVDPVGMM